MSSQKRQKLAKVSIGSHTMPLLQGKLISRSEAKTFSL